MPFTASKRRILLTYIAVLIGGYALFIAPNLFFGIFKVGGGLTGLNLAWVGLFQLASVTALVWWAVRSLGGSFRSIGWDFSEWPRQFAIGGAIGLAWALFEMLVLIPSHGGAEEPNVARIIENIDSQVIGLVGYLVWGVIGGGITEEIFNRGFTINVLRAVFDDKRLGLWVAATLSIVLFMVGHLPQNGFDWITILIPTLIYTGLFVFTGKLAAPIAAHAVHNAVVLGIIYARYIA
ncbi:CPBP family intramembrane glutamic endopeptidase [Pseudoblastomonas halimionae]|uniref:CPBP family intramembrane metalloprotease n=1 Tax=Alteriqipengyuania halimionae TaxID=1926630 RepID=A0A6I4U8E4_9SPHN|nr:CPBP family intramembrane glutamic endopeptidase [Alteriqipengyuania halimionae]MXP10537.1 CPBP family intramembrane metalloprotease [Alteriqipengyuania halimionae]